MTSGLKLSYTPTQAAKTKKMEASIGITVHQMVQTLRVDTFSQAKAGVSCEMNGQRYLRVVLLNPDTTIKHLKALVEEIKKIAQKQVKA